MIFITGAAGFIGSNVVAGLLEDGYEIIASDNFEGSAKWKNLVNQNVFEIIRPVETLDWLKNNKEKISAIVHMGAVSATTERNVDFIIENNFRLSVDLWSLACQFDIPFIYASSAATYGDGSNGFYDSENLEENLLLRPLNPYGWSKLAVDRRFIADIKNGRCHPPQWAGLRFFNVYGPNEFHKGEMRSIVNKIYGTVKSREPIFLFKSYREDFPDGGQMRDFVYVEDCVNVVRWLLKNKDVSGIFNVGSGVARPFIDVATIIINELMVPSQIEFIEMPRDVRGHYQYFTEARMEKIRDFGFELELTSLELGIRSYIRALEKDSGLWRE